MKTPIMAVSAAPQLFLDSTTAFRQWLTAGALALPLLQSAWTDGGVSLLVAAAALAGAVAAETLLDAASGSARGTSRDGIADGSAAVTALVLTLLLPNRLNPALAALGAVFAVVVVKRSFGGLGANWLNPAVGGWLFVRASWPLQFAAAMADSPTARLADAVAKGSVDANGSPMAILRLAGLKTSAVDTAVSSALNAGLFGRWGAELPGGYIDLFAQNGPGLIADRGWLGLIVAVLILSAGRVSRPAVPIVFLAVFLPAVRLTGALPFGGGWGQGDMLFALATGGTLLGAYLLAADPATGPKSAGGAWIVAATGAVLVTALRYFSADPFALVLAVALVNAGVPALRLAERRWSYLPRRKVIE
jgi:electron transport complex protein RnfD